MLASEILSDVRVLAKVDTNDVTDNQLLAMLNRSINDMAKFVVGLHEDFFLKQGTSQNIVSGTQDYTLATDILQLKRVEVSADGTNYYVAQRKDLAEQTNLNAVVESTYAPKYMTITQTSSTGFVIRLLPSPTANVTNGLRYWYISRPAALSATSETPAIPDDLHPALVQELVMKLAQRDVNQSRFTLAKSLRDETMREWRTQVAQRNIDRAQTLYASPFQE